MGILFFCLIYAGDYTRDFENGLFRVNFPVKTVVMDNSLKEIVSMAMTEWEKEIGVDIWESVERQGDLFIYWSSHFSQFNTLGKTRRIYKHSSLERIEILLNENNFFLKNNRILKWVLLHELGHSMGLGHSKKEEDIMYGHLGMKIGLSKEDIERGKKVVLF